MLTFIRNNWPLCLTPKSRRPKPIRSQAGPRGNEQVMVILTKNQVEQALLAYAQEHYAPTTPQVYISVYPYKRSDGMAKSDEKPYDYRACNGRFDMQGIHVEAAVVFQVALPLE